jgi:hypothetical protein
VERISTSWIFHAGSSSAVGSSLFWPSVLRLDQDDPDRLSRHGLGGRIDAVQANHRHHRKPTGHRMIDQKQDRLAAVRELDVSANDAFAAKLLPFVRRVPTQRRPLEPDWASEPAWPGVADRRRGSLSWRRGERCRSSCFNKPARACSFAAVAESLAA